MRWTFAIAALLGALLAAPAASARPMTADEEELFDELMDYQFDAAMALADRLLVADPRNAYLHKSRLFIDHNDYTRDLEKGVAEYRARLEREPGDPLWTLMVLYGEMWLAMRLPDAEARKTEYERLRDRIKELCEQQPDMAELSALRARVFGLLGSAHEAGQAAEEAIRLDPDNFPFRFSSAAEQMSGAAVERNHHWLRAYAKNHPAGLFARTIRVSETDWIETEAERALRLQELLPSVLGTRQEDDVRVRLAQLDRHADENLQAILAHGFCNESVTAVQIAADRAKGKEGVWTWFSTEEVRKENQRKSLALLAESERSFRVIPGEILALEAQLCYALEEYGRARECVARIGAQGKQETRHAADNLFLVGDCYYAEKNYEEARLAYDKILEGNAGFPIPSRLRHLECMVRQYPLMAIGQGSGMFFLFLSLLVSVALVAARLRHARRYFRLAAWLAILVTGLELTLYVKATGEFGAGALLVGIVGFFKNVSLLTAGMLLCARGGRRPFAALRDLEKARRARRIGAWARSSVGSAAILAACWFVLLAGTLALFAAVRPTANKAVSVSKPLESATDRQQAKAPETSLLAAVLVLLVAPAMEEILYRWFLFGLFQAYLRRYRWSVGFAIGLTAFLWAAGHLGGVDPWWFRLVQTTGAGIVLGWVRWRYGVENSFAVHTTYNGAQLLLESILPRFLK